MFTIFKNSPTGLTTLNLYAYEYHLASTSQGQKDVLSTHEHYQNAATFESLELRQSRRTFTTEYLFTASCLVQLFALDCFLRFLVFSFINITSLAL